MCDVVHVGAVLDTTPIRCCRYVTEDVVDPIAVVAGLVQTGLYLDFFYVYFTKCVSALPLSTCTHGVALVVYRVLQGQKFELPA